MVLRWALAFGIAVHLMAQTPPPPAKPPAATVNPLAAAVKQAPVGPAGTLSGTVTEKGTMLPIERAQIQIVGSNGSDTGSSTDAEGKFSVFVPPGSYRLTLRRQGQNGNLGIPAVHTAIVRLNEETKLQIEMAKTAEISGTVTDSRGEPVANARVTLLMHAYEAWSTNRIYQNTPFTTQSNDVGEYTISDVPPGLAVFIYAETQGSRQVEAYLTDVAEAGSRRPLTASTFYPQALDPAGALSVTLAEGERRERLDIRMARTDSFCAEGHVLPIPMGEIRYTMNVDVTNVNSGVFNDIGSYRAGRSVYLNKDGDARICGLWPGSYRVTVQPQQRQQSGAFFGRGEFTITDKDISSITVLGAPQFDWPGEVIIDGPAPTEAIKNKMQMTMISVTVTGVGTSATSDIPGKFLLKGLHIDRALLRFSGYPDGWYVKQAMYGDDDLNLRIRRFVLDKPDTPLKVILGQDGARIKIKVVDDKGEPLVNTRVVLVRSGLQQAAKLVGQLMLSYTDERGEASVFSLTLEPPIAAMAPGEYYVLAAEMPYNQTADVLDQVWSTLQTRATKVTLRANTTTEVTVKPVTLR